MFSIGEFARLGTVSVRTLRHYDEIGLLHPAKVDPNTGYRSYAADQLGQLNRIMALKDLGFSLEQTRKLISGITLEELRGMLALRRAQLEQELEEYLTRLQGVEARLRYIEGETAMPADDITVKKIPELGVVAIAAPRPRAGTRSTSFPSSTVRERSSMSSISPGGPRSTGPSWSFSRAGSSFTRQGDANNTWGS
jgi:DNA-binding transcriptional MerR regulator